MAGRLNWSSKAKQLRLLPTGQVLFQAIPWNCTGTRTLVTMEDAAPGDQSDQHKSHKRRGPYERVSLDGLPLETGQLALQFPQRLGKRLKSPENIYIGHTDVASLVMKHLCHSTMNKESIILEASPGPGVLTELLLKSGVPRLRVFETKEEFLVHLRALSQLRPTQLEIFERDILTLPRLQAREFHTGETITSSMFAGIQMKKWNEGPPLRLFAVMSPTNEVKFLRFMLFALAHLSSIFIYGRCEILAFISGKEYTYMTAQSDANYLKYRSSTVLYNLLFNIEMLEKVPREMFLPQVARRKYSRTELFDNKHMYLVRLTPLADLFETVASPDHLPDLYFFIRQHLSRRTSLIIPSMERWIPHCGPRLIKNGIGVFTKFGELSPKELLNIFQQFIQWPEYEGSLFRSAVLATTQERDDNLLLEEE